MINIVICIYKNNVIGRDLATGNGQKFTNEEKKEAWLLMYSFNDVEGQYIDNNPGRYLGN